MELNSSSRFRNKTIWLEHAPKMSWDCAFSQYFKAHRYGHTIQIKEVLGRIQEDERALGTSDNNWNLVRNMVMWYVKKNKAEHQFNSQGQDDTTRAVTGKCWIERKQYLREITWRLRCPMPR